MILTRARLRPLLLRAAAVLITGTAATGCFTGVESTPKITDADVRRETTPPTPDETYLHDVRYAPRAQWQEGRPFVVTDAKISRALVPDAYGQRQLAEGDTLRYEGLTPGRSLASELVSDLRFIDTGGNGFTFRVDVEPDSLLQRVVKVPFAIDCDIVDQTSAKLLGKRFYIVTSARRDSAGTIWRARKFVPVTVDEVAVGTAVNPVRVRIVDEGNPPAYLFINPEARSGRSAGSFASMLSLTNPRDRYPLITDAVWENITNNRVSVGMTRQECKLALGAPAEVIQRPGYGYLYEAWRYDNGTYLMFEDGLLVK